MSSLGRYLLYAVHGVKPVRRSPRRRRQNGIVRDWRYLAAIRTLPSIVSGLTPCEACHTGSDGGMGIKASDLSCVPLTWFEHREYHRIGKEAFERKYNLDLAAVVRFLNSEYRREHA